MVNKERVVIKSDDIISLGLLLDRDLNRGRSVLGRLFDNIEVDHNGGCWKWTGTLNDYGYGRFYIHKTHQSFPAHQLTYIIYKGVFAPNLEIDHLCRNPCCVNPNHLEPVLHKENCIRGMAPIVNGNRERRKTHCPNGHPYDENNTRWHKGGRRCKTCQHERNHRSYWNHVQRNRELAVERSRLYRLKRKEQNDKTKD